MQRSVNERGAEHCSECSADGSKLPEYVEVPSFVPKAALNAVAILKLLEGDDDKQTDSKFDR